MRMKMAGDAEEGGDLSGESPTGRDPMRLE